MRITIILFTMMMLGCAGRCQKLEEPTTYEVGISFNSTCCGVPSETPLREFIDSFKLKNSIPEIKAVHIGPLGREGEYRIGFPLTEMNEAQKDVFINGLKEIKKLIGDPGMLHIIQEMKINMQELPKRAKQKEVQF